MVDRPNIHTHGDGVRGPIPTRSQRVRLTLLQVVHDENGTIRLIPVLSEFSPSNLGAILAEGRGVGGTVFPRGNFLTIFTLEVDDINLGSDQFPSIKLEYSVLKAHVLLCMPCGRQLRVQRGIHDVGIGDAKIVLPSEWFNGGTLGWPYSMNRTCQEDDDSRASFRQAG